MKIENYNLCVNTEIKTTPQISHTAKIKSSAPTWVVDGFNEMVGNGLTNVEAITKLRESPFFLESDYVEV